MRIFTYLHACITTEQSIQSMNRDLSPIYSARSTRLAKRTRKRHHFTRFLLFQVYLPRQANAKVNTEAMSSDFAFLLDPVAI